MKYAIRTHDGEPIGWMLEPRTDAGLSFLASEAGTGGSRRKGEPRTDRRTPRKSEIDIDEALRRRIRIDRVLRELGGDDRRGSGA